MVTYFFVNEDFQKQGMILFAEIFMLPAKKFLGF
jgi:hypothetical protein